MILSIAAVVLLTLSGLALLVSRDWRWSIAAMVLMYIGQFLLVSQVWPGGIALVKLVVGWMSSAAIGLTCVGQPDEQAREAAWPSSRIFRLIAAGLVLLVVYATAPAVLGWFPGISLYQVWGGLILIGLGLLILGMTGTPFRVVLTLLMILAGFEIFYAVVESSVLVAGLLAAVNLGLALAGSYLVYPRSAEESE